MKNLIKLAAKLLLSITVLSSHARADSAELLSQQVELEKQLAVAEQELSKAKSTEGADNIILGSSAVAALIALGHTLHSFSEFTRISESIKRDTNAGYLILSERDRQLTERSSSGRFSLALFGVSVALAGLMYRDGKIAREQQVVLLARIVELKKSLGDYRLIENQIQK